MTTIWGNDPLRTVELVTVNTYGDWKRAYVSGVKPVGNITNCRISHPRQQTTHPHEATHYFYTRSENTNNEPILLFITDGWGEEIIFEGAIGYEKSRSCR